MKKVEYHSWRIPDYTGEEISPDTCENFDNIPVKTAYDYFLEFMANGQISENNTRKMFFGDQYDCSDNMEFIDLYKEKQAEKVALYRQRNEAYTKAHNDQVKAEQEKVRDLIKDNEQKQEVKDK